MILIAVLLTLSQPIDCETIHAQVQQHGKVRAYAWALSHGYSPKEITRIRKACGI